MASVTVSRSAGRLIAIKQVAAERAEDVQQEADLLRRLNHPGLVRFVDVVVTENGGRALHTEFVNSDTWASRPLADPSERAAGMAALAAVVADLHQLGVARLQLTPTHILHGEDDFPVLCGLTSTADASPENRLADIVALADLCHDPSMGRGAVATKLFSLAETARAGTLSARELARRLKMLSVKRPARSAPVRVAGGGVLASLRRRVRPKPLIWAGAVVVAACAAFVIGARNGDPGPAPQEASGVPTEIGPGKTGDTAVHANPAATTDGRAAPDTEDPAGTVDTGAPGRPADGADTESSSDPAGARGSADGPSPIAEAGQSAVSVREAAAIIEHGGRRYAIGATGDFVETGDWDCDGEATAAIVRPGTGGVVLFDDWPGPGGTISLPVRWSVDSPTGADAVAHGQCDLLRVYTTAGSKLFNPGEAS